MYKKGKIPDLPPLLEEHLKKFTNRKLNFKHFEPPNIQATKTQKYQEPSGEFAQIITSFENLKNRSSENETNQQSCNSMNEIQSTKKPLKETYLVTQPKEFVNKKLITLNEMEKQENNILSATTDQSKKSEEIVLEQNNTLETVEDENIQKYKQVNKGINKTKPNVNHLIYPERIKIPKKKYKKDHIFKLNDCYYDDDGEFLYRVPGMD